MKCFFHLLMVWFGLMAFYAIFNNISVISWRSGLLVEKTGVLGENHRPVTDILYYIMFMYRVHSAMNGFELTTLVVIGTDTQVVVNLTTILLRPRRSLIFANEVVNTVIVINIFFSFKSNTGYPRWKKHSVMGIIWIHSNYGTDIIIVDLTMHTCMNNRCSGDLRHR